jgi:hypothetical protein
VRGHVDVKKIPIIDTQPTPPVEKQPSKGTESKGKRELWQVMAMEGGLNIHFAALQDLIKRKKCSTSIDPTVAALAGKTYEDFHQNHKLRKQLRKVLKSQGLYESNPLPSMHSFYDVPEREKHPCPPTATRPEESPVAEREEEKKASLKYQKSTSGDRVITDSGTSSTSSAGMEGYPRPQTAGDQPPAEPPPPCIFRLHSGDKIDNGASNSAVVYITGPVQAVQGDFRMRVLDTSTGLTMGAPSRRSSPLAGAEAADQGEEEARGAVEEGDWLHCETRMEVLGHGFYQGQAVTKVKLMPVSGRRHQLRLHCLLLGHPIGIHPARLPTYLPAYLPAYLSSVCLVSSTATAHLFALIVLHSPRWFSIGSGRRYLWP